MFTGHYTGVQGKGNVQPITEAQIAEKKQEFARQITRELITAGAESEPAVKNVLASIADRLNVSRESGRVGYWPQYSDGGHVTARNAADAVLEEARELERRAGFGPEPHAAVLDRLTRAGAGAVAKEKLAAAGLRYNDDGFVVSAGANGKPLVDAPELAEETKADADKLKTFRDAHNTRALTVVTRDLLDYDDRNGAERQVEVDGKRTEMSGAL